MRIGLKGRYVLKKMMILAAIMLLTIGGITPLITANTPLIKTRSTNDVQNPESTCLRNLNYQKFVQVEVSKWTEDDGLINTIEIWPKDKVDGFRDAMDSVANGQRFSIMQQYGLIPQGRTQADFKIFLAEQYKQTKIIKNLDRQQINTANSRSKFFNVFISGEVYAPFFCSRIPFLLYVIRSDNGGNIVVENEDWVIPLSGNQLFDMFMCIWIGIFLPPLINGNNHIDREFFGTAGYLSIEIK